MNGSGTQLWYPRVWETVLGRSACTSIGATSTTAFKLEKVFSGHLQSLDVTTTWYKGPCPLTSSLWLAHIAKISLFHRKAILEIELTTPTSTSTQSSDSPIVSASTNSTFSTTSTPDLNLNLDDTNPWLTHQVDRMNNKIFRILVDVVLLKCDGCFWNLSPFN